ncbi:methyltransferase domain-containing protein [bacterium]|nr:methyltransferase domain-containing protein [bacterium]
MDLKKRLNGYPQWRGGHNTMFEEKMLEFLACPECKGDPLKLDISEQRNSGVTEGKLVCSFCNREYVIKEGVPILLPDIFLRDNLYDELLVDESKPKNHDFEAWHQWRKKQDVCVNLSREHASLQISSEEYHYWAKRLSESFSIFCNIKNNVLDIGCGDPSQSIKYMSGTNYYYVGVDPFIAIKKSPFPLIQGLGEYLPIRNNCFDNATLITTLDHSIYPEIILEETRRVLRDGGNLFMMILIWDSQFSTEKDDFHFRHFSRNDIFNMLPYSNFEVKETQIIAYKESYRHVLFLRAEKSKD